jgi:nicotinate-nucleotide adenylyltransferase
MVLIALKRTENVKQSESLSTGIFPRQNRCTKFKRNFPHRVVPGTGFEPALPFGNLILSQKRLPFRHPGPTDLLVPISSDETKSRRMSGTVSRRSCGAGNQALPRILSPIRVVRVKIGFLGGSFDPVHFGHLLAAQDAYEQYNLDRLVLVPAAQAPLKPNDIQSSPEDRLAMLRASIECDPRFEISDLELRRGGVSFTVDSGRHYRALYPHDDLYWIIGGDQVPQLHLWREIQELACLVEFIFVERPGHAATPRSEIPGLRWHRCDGHLLAISSTELRERTQRNLSLDYFVPHKVLVYIKNHSLYRHPR